MIGRNIKNTKLKPEYSSSRTQQDRGLACWLGLQNCRGSYRTHLPPQTGLTVWHQ